MEEALIPFVGAGSDILVYVLRPFEDRGNVTRAGSLQEVISRLGEVAEAADILNLPQQRAGAPRVRAPLWFQAHRAPDFVLVKAGAVLAVPLRQWGSGIASRTARGVRWMLARRILGLTGLWTFVVTVVVGVLIVVLGAIINAVLIPRLFPPP